MEFVALLLGYIEVLLFAWGIAQVHFCKNRIRWGIGAVLLTLCAVFEASGNINEIILLGVVMALLVFSFFMFFDERFLRGIAKYFFCFLYIGFVYLPAGVVIACVAGKLLNIDIDENLYDIIRSVMTMILIFCITLLIRKKKNLVGWIEELPTVYFAVAAICGIFASGIGAYGGDAIKDAGKNERILFETMRTLLNISVYILGIAFSFADFLRRKYKAEGMLKDENIRIYREYSANVVEHIKEIRRIKHDMQSHLKIISKYADDGNMSELKEYINNIAEDINFYSGKLYNTGNEIVDTLFTDKIKGCKDKEIVIECNGRLDVKNLINDYDLCIIFSNLLSNAIEACERIKYGEKIIRVFLQSNENTMKVMFENPVEWEVDVENLEESTFKADKENHGFGIGNIKRTVEKYGGHMVMKNSKGMFQTVIIISV